MALRDTTTASPTASSGTLEAIVHAHTALTPDDLAWLTALVHEWHLLADLSFSDLILWVPDVDPNVFWAAAQVRPTTGPTALEDDVVGDDIAYNPEHLVTEAYLSETISGMSDGQLGAGIPVDVHAIPVMHGGRCIGVVERHTNRMGVRAPGALEDAYLETAELLSRMLWRGEFPQANKSSSPSRSPRVGDGMMRVDVSGVVTFASPNAVSAYRRLGLAGDLEGENLRDVTIRLVGHPRSPVDTALATVLASAADPEVDVENGSMIVRLRVLPLLRDGEPAGTLVLCRDTSELRHRERQLITKDATIREIHHRVKNNLQTVAALLRLQSRRIRNPEAKSALGEAMSRVTAIALVHEILSQSYDEVVAFDDVCDRVLRMVGDLAATRGTTVARRVGTFGDVPADVATSLSLIITELCHNAVEHGYAQGSGTVEVVPTLVDGSLRVDIVDEGAGLPADFTIAGATSLGLSIVSTLVADLGGAFELEANSTGRGSRATVVIPLGNG